MSIITQNGNSLFLINYATQIICFVVVTPLVLLRLLVRWKLVRGLGVDDVSCFVGFLLFMGFCANGLIYGFSGCTYPSLSLQDDKFEYCIKLSYVATAIYAPTVLFVKVSLITILIRVFQPYNEAIISLYVLLSVVIGYYTIITFIKIFICNPVSAYWTGTHNTDGHCLNQPGVIIADSIISFVTDVTIFAFPVVFTWSLQMPIRKKIKVMVILGFGGIALAFSLYRLVIGVHEKFQPHETRMFMGSILTANAEIGFGLICACLPALNILTSYTQQRFPFKGIFTRGTKSSNPSDEPIYNGLSSSNTQNQFGRSHVDSFARWGSAGSAGLIAHEQMGLNLSGENSNSIKMSSLNQHWEDVSASPSNRQADNSEII